MSRPVIHFAHANGFPKSCYGELLTRLEKEFDVIGKPMLAHDPRFPVQDNWNSSADEIIEFIENASTEKVIGLGHSFGGTITLKAAAKRPDLFSKVILLDPVLMVGFLPSRITRLLKKVGRIGSITPADKTMGRKREWASQAEARSYFKGKPLFKEFTDHSLDLYVSNGLQEHDGGLSLRFNVPTEVNIYKGIPTDVDQLSKIKLQMPGSIIRGTSTDVAYSPFVNRVARQHKMNVIKINGSHMFPFEVPLETADIVVEQIFQTN